MNAFEEYRHNQKRDHFRWLGYTEEYDFPGEYRLLVNPETMVKVRIYYGTGKVWEYK